MSTRMENTGGSMRTSSLKLPILNQATFAGRVAANPEPLPSTTASATRFVVTVAGRSKENPATHVPCIAWGGIADAILQNIRCGGAILVTGALSSRRDSRDVFVRVTAVQFLDEDKSDRG